MINLLKLTDEQFIEVFKHFGREIAVIEDEFTVYNNMYKKGKLSKDETLTLCKDLDRRNKINKGIINACIETNKQLLSINIGENKK